MAASGGHFIKGGTSSPGESRAFVPAALAKNVEVREIVSKLESRFAELSKGVKNRGEHNMLRNEIRYERGQLKALIDKYRKRVRPKAAA